VSVQHFQSLTECWIGPGFFDNGSRSMSSEESIFQGKNWTLSLIQAGFSRSTAHSAIAFLSNESHVSRAPWQRGVTLHCGARIDMRRVNELPSSEATMDAVLHALLYLGPDGPLSPKDFALVNFGLHSEWRGVHAVRLETWWAKEHARRRAPHLLWRQASPQHWPSQKWGMYSAELAKRSTQCSALDEAAVKKQRHSWSLLQPRTLPSEWGSLLPVYDATVQRFDEHPPLKTPHTQTGSTNASRGLLHPAAEAPSGEDCTHYCEPSSVFRLWTQVTLAFIRSLTNHG